MSNEFPGESLCSSILLGDLSNLPCDMDTVWNLWPLSEQLRPVLNQPETQTITPWLHLHLRHLADTFKKGDNTHILCIKLLQHHSSDHTWASCCQEIFWIASVLCCRKCWQSPLENLKSNITVWWSSVHLCMCNSYMCTFLFGGQGSEK